MDNRDEKIRVRAYEIWERQGRTGDPEDHWYEAEREIKAEEASTGTSQEGVTTPPMGESITAMNSSVANRIAAKTTGSS